MPCKDPWSISREEWLRQIFSSKAARDGGVVRRKVADIDRMVGRDAFLSELRRRGFRAVENAGQYVIFCNRGPIKIVN